MQTFLCLSDQISISIHPVLISIHQILFSVQTSSAVRPKLDSVWILARPTLLFQSITFPLEKQAARKFCLEIAFPQNILVEKAAKISFYILRLDEETGRQSIRADFYQRRVETRWKMEEEENIFIFLFIVCLEDEGGNMSRSYSIVIISQSSSSYLFPRRRMITSSCFFHNNPQREWRYHLHFLEDHHPHHHHHHHLHGYHHLQDPHGWRGETGLALIGEVHAAP